MWGGVGEALIVFIVEHINCALEMSKAYSAKFSSV